LSSIAKGGLVGLLTGGALGGLFQLARREIARAGRWMPREADRLEEAVQELRLALRDPDQMRSMRAVHRLRELRIWDETSESAGKNQDGVKNA
jgi:hypothetical protein